MLRSHTQLPLLTVLDRPIADFVTGPKSAARIRSPPGDLIRRERANQQDLIDGKTLPAVCRKSHLFEHLDQWSPATDGIRWIDRDPVRDPSKPNMK